MRHENACLLGSQNLDYHCDCPTITLIKFGETGGTVTHSLQVLHPLQWHQPSKREQTEACSRVHPQPYPALGSPFCYLVLATKFSHERLAILVVCSLEGWDTSF